MLPRFWKTGIYRVGGADIPGTEIYTLNGAGTQLTISGFTGVDVTNATNFQLFADIQVGATPTNDFTISLVPGGVTIAPGTLLEVVWYLLQCN
jgi:hypothetical protein